MLNSPTRPQVSSINSVHEFWKNINRECTRGERYKNKLSLIIYEIGRKNERDPAFRQFIRKMAQRVRTMDDIGWFDLEQIGVLLPHTPTEGAFRLSKDISNLLLATPTPLPFTIYSYPSQRWPVKQKLPWLLNVRLALQNIFHPHSITSSDNFRIYLSIELDRATRYGYQFSLIIFHLDKINTQGNPATKIARHLNKRLRETDEIGWFGEKKIAAILPYAENHNCHEIVAFICNDASITCEGAYSVYTYPSNWLSDINLPSLQIPQHAEQRNNKEVPSQTKQPKIHENNGGKLDPRPTRRNSSVTVTDDNRERTEQYEKGRTSSRKKAPLAEIERFFAKPIPFWKRSLDIIASVLGLIFLAPIFILATIGIKATSPGTILFKQKRVGYMQKQFSLLKFRSMHTNADQESHRKLMQRLISKEGDKGNTKLEQDKRIFAFGRFLRKSSIDELPQLLNVLRGEMSLVGPRPCLPYEAEEYLRWHTKRFLTMPGLTGLWQVSGKNKLSFKQMIRLDISYEKKLSFWFDLQILLKTIPTVFKIFFETKE